MIITKYTGGYFSRLNFIDHNDNFVGWDDSDNCCEHHWYAVLDTLSDGAVPLDEGYLEQYHFDTSVLPRESEEHEFNVSEDGGAMIFALAPDSGQHRPLYLVVFNDHNGYYSHGWEYSIGGKSDSGAL